MFCLLATEIVIQTKYHTPVKCGKQVSFQLLLVGGGGEGAVAGGRTHGL